MSHHNSNDQNHKTKFGSDSLEEMKSEEMEDWIKQDLKKRYPNGMMNDQDQGCIEIMIGLENGRVKLTFPYPVYWIGLSPEKAVLIAESLIKNAKQLKVIKTKILNREAIEHIIQWYHAIQDINSEYLNFKDADIASGLVNHLKLVDKLNEYKSKGLDITDITVELNANYTVYSNDNK